MNKPLSYFFDTTVPFASMRIPSYLKTKLIALKLLTVALQRDQCLAPGCEMYFILWKMKNTFVYTGNPRVSTHNILSKSVAYTAEHLRCKKLLHQLELGAVQ